MADPTPAPVADAGEPDFISKMLGDAAAGRLAPPPSQTAEPAAPPTQTEPQRDPVRDLMDQAIAGKLKPPAGPETEPGSPQAPMSQNEMDLETGGTGDVPIIPAGRNSQHMMQGIGKALVGTAGFVGDLGANAQRQGESMARASDQNLTADPWSYDPETGAPLRFRDASGKMVDPSAGQPIAQPFMSSGRILGGLKSVGIDPYRLPVTSGADAVNEGIGSALANIPLMFTGGGAAAGVRGAVPAVTRWGGSILRGAAEGAGAGLVETPGDLSERLPAAAEGAVLGAGVGAVVPPVAGAINWVGSRMGKTAVPGFEEPVASRGAYRVGNQMNDKLGDEGKAAVEAAATPDTYTAGYSPTLSQIVNNPPDASPAPFKQSTIDNAVELEQAGRAQNPGMAIQKARDQANSERKAIADAGGTGNPADTAARLDTGNKVLQDDAQRQEATARDNAAFERDSLPEPHFADDSITPTTAGEQYGADTRATLLTARKTAEDARNDLQSQINQDGNVVVNAAPIRENLEERYTLGRYDEPPAGKEAGILADLKTLPANAKLTDLQTLRTRINDAIDELTPPDTRMGAPARRLLSVRQSIDQAIDESAAQAGSRARGLSGEQRFMTPDEANLHGQVQAMNREIAANYDNGAIGDVLRFGGSSSYPSAAKDLVGPGVTRANGSFSRADAQVMPRIWDGSVNENTNVAQFVKAGGDEDKLSSYVAHDLNEAATDPKTGFLDPTKYAAWRRQHAAGMNALPSLSLGFDTLAEAQQKVYRAIADSTARMDAYNTKAAQAFMHMKPVEAVKELLANGGSALDNVTKLIRQMPDSPTNPNQAALAGIRKAFGDYIAEQYHPLTVTGTTEADLARARNFNTFLTSHADVLKLVFADGYDNFLLKIGKQLTDRVNASPAIRGSVPKADHPLTAGNVVQAELMADVAKEIPIVGKVAGPLLIGRAMVKWLGKGGKDEGRLLTAATMNPTTTGLYLMNLRATDGAINPQMLRRLIPAMTAAGVVPDAPEPETPAAEPERKPPASVDTGNRLPDSLSAGGAKPLTYDGYEKRQQPPTAFPAPAPQQPDAPSKPAPITEGPRIPANGPIFGPQQRVGANELSRQAGASAEPPIQMTNPAWTGGSWQSLAAVEPTKGRFAQKPDGRLLIGDGKGWQQLSAPPADGEVRRLPPNTIGVPAGGSGQWDAKERRYVPRP